jgi:hypothetical protein
MDILLLLVIFISLGFFWLAIGFFHVRIWQWCSFDFKSEGFPGLKTILLLSGPAGMALIAAMYLVAIILIGFDWAFGGRFYQLKQWWHRRHSISI